MKYLLIGAIMASAVPAAASVSLISGNGNPAAGVTGGAQTTFEDVDSGSYTILTTPSFTFTAGSGTYFDISSDYSGQFNNTGQSLQGAFEDGAVQSLGIGLSAPVRALAFNFGGADTNWTLEAFDPSGTSLGRVTLLPTHAGNAGTYYGIASSDQNIARALLSVDLANYDPSTLHPDYVFIDNVTSGQVAATAPVPEPGEWAMMAAGLGIVGALARRRARRGDAA